MAADCGDDEAPAVAPTCHFTLSGYESLTSFIHAFIVHRPRAFEKPNAELDPIVSPLTFR